MKIYDWKALISPTLSSGILILAFALRFNNIFDLLIILILCCLLVHGLRISLTKSGYEAEQRRIENAKELRQKMVDKYGKSAYFLLYSPYVVLLVGIYISLALAYASPHKILAAVILIVTLVMYVIQIIVNKALEKKFKIE